MRQILVLSLLLAPAPLFGQRISTFQTYALPETSLRESAGLPFTQAVKAIPRTYWLEGGIIGGVGLGVTSALELHKFCESGSCVRATLGGALLGGALGFTVGALIGGQIHKTARSSGP
jgi:hypothetical protein